LLSEKERVTDKDVRQKRERGERERDK